MSNEVMLMGLEAASRRLGVSSGHLRKLADLGEIKTMRDSANRRIFFSSDVEAFAAKREAKKAKANGGLRLRSKG